MLFRLLPVQGQMADQQLPLGHTDEPATSVGHSQVGLPMLLKVKFPSSLTRQESVKDNAFGGWQREATDILGGRRQDSQGSSFLPGKIRYGYYTPYWKSHHTLGRKVQGKVILKHHQL